MKVRIDIDCTPDEARAFFGLPDIGPLQQAFVGEMDKRMRDAVANMDVEAIFKAWMPQGMAGLEQWQTLWQEAAAKPKK